MKKKNMYKPILGILAGSLCVLSTFSAVAAPMYTGWNYNAANDTWKFYADDGMEFRNWLLFDGDWYYLDGENGIMQTSWTDIRGERYFFNTISNGKKGAMLKGWQWIDGNQYYFESQVGSSQGKLYRDTIAGNAVDGIARVDAQGRRLDDKGNVIVDTGVRIYTDSTALNMAETSNSAAGASEATATQGTVKAGVNTTQSTRKTGTTSSNGSSSSSGSKSSSSSKSLSSSKSSASSNDSSSSGSSSSSGGSSSSSSSGSSGSSGTDATSSATK